MQIRPPSRRPARLRFLLLLTLLLQLPAAQAGSNTLAEIMKELGTEMCRANQALLEEDFGQLAASARSIADHPRPGVTERLRVLGGLGSDVARFRSSDVRLNETALSLAQAADDADPEAAVQAYGQLLEQCMDCHASFRARVRALLHP